jgi:hypothetical protein
VILVTSPVISHEGVKDRIVILVTSPVISHEGLKDQIVILITSVFGCPLSWYLKSFLSRTNAI